MAVERRSVLKRTHEPHPLETIPPPPTVAPTDGSTEAAAPTGDALRPPTELPKTTRNKVPVNYRLPIDLVDRLDAASVYLPAKLGHRITKNGIVEQALHDFLTKHGH